MKELYKAVIERREGTQEGVKVLDKFDMYTSATSVSEAQGYIRYRLEKDNIHIGVDGWRIARLDLERNYDEKKEVKKEMNIEKEIIKFDDENQLAISNLGKIYKYNMKDKTLEEAHTHLNGKALCITKGGVGMNVATLVYTTFKGKIDGVERYKFDYIDNNPMNCKLSNLKLKNGKHISNKKYHFSEEELKEFIRGMKERGEI